VLKDSHSHKRKCFWSRSCSSFWSWSTRNADEMFASSSRRCGNYATLPARPDFGRQKLDYGLRTGDSGRSCYEKECKIVHFLN